MHAGLECGVIEVGLGGKGCDDDVLGVVSAQDFVGQQGWGAGIGGEVGSQIVGKLVG